MAQIPGAQGFGEAVARPMRLNETQVPRAAFGSDLAATVANVGADMYRAEQEQARVAEQTRRAADRAAAVSEMQFAADDLAVIDAEFADGIKSGTIDKTRAREEYTAKARDRVSTALLMVPTDHRADVQRDLDHRVRKGTLGITKSVTLRDQHDIRSGIDQTIESASRLYLKDPAAADSMVAGTLEALGPFSGLAPEQVSKVGQAYRESSRFTKGYTMVNEARRSNEALAKVETALGGEDFADMDPQRKAQLLTTLEGYKVANIQKAEADARRREAEAERYMRKAEAQFNAAQSITNSGKVLSPEYVDQVSKAVAGTPYALAFKESLKGAAEHTAFGVQPLAAQAKLLEQARGGLNQKGTNPAAEKRLSSMQHIYDEAVRDYAKDPLPAALERGVITQLAPLDMRNIGGLVQGLGERVAQSQLVAQQTGKPVSPLTMQESEKVGDMLALLPATDRSKAVAQLSTTVGPQVASALAEQLAKKDRALGLAFGMAGMATTEGRFTSELVLKGAQAKKDGTSTKGEKEPDVKAARWKATAAAQLDGAFPTPGLTDAYRDAAEFIMHGIAAEQGGRLSARDMERSVELAIGGKLVDHNGRKVPLPAGVDTDMLDKRLRTVTRDELLKQAPTGTVRAGGQEVYLEDFTKSLPGQELIYAGPGRYSVIVGGRPVTNAEGRRIVIGVAP